MENTENNGLNEGQNTTEPATVIVTLHESMEATITAAIAELRATAADVEIAKLKADYQNATIAGVSDKDGYKFVTEGIRKMKAIRSAIENKRKELKAPALKYGKSVDGEAERLKSQLEALEKSLAAKKLEIDQAAEIRFNKRTTDLFALGYSFDGIVYFFSGQDVNLGTKTITPTDIRDVEIFEPVLAECAKFVESVKIERKRLADIAEAEAKAERERIEAERLAAEEKQRQAEAKAAAEAAEKERLRLENEAKDRELEELRRQLAEKNNQAGVEPATGPSKPIQDIGDVLESDLAETSIVKKGATPGPTSQAPQIKIDPAKLSQIPAAGVVNTQNPNHVPNPAAGPAPKSAPVWQKPQMKTQDYIYGFNACKSAVLVMFADVERKHTRAEWLAVFNGLQP